MRDCVLITGTAGFIGSHLAQRLLSDVGQVVGVDNFCDFYDPSIKRQNISQALESRDFTLVESDIRDRKRIFDVFESYRPRVVVHLAAMAGVRPSIEMPDYYTDVNLNGTVNLLDAAVEFNTAKFIFASSSSVYGNNQKVPFAEDDNVDHPISPYAATKKAGELICHTYWHLHQLPIVALRFFTVYGPRQRPDLAICKFLELVSEARELPMFGDGNSSRDYTYIDDIIDGILAAVDYCDKSRGYRIFNLGSDSPVSLKEMINTIESVVGQKARIKQLPMQPGDVNRTWADLTSVKAELGYQPGTVLEDGITRQWQWMRTLAQSH